MPQKSRLIYDLLAHAARINPTDSTFLKRRPNGEFSSFSYSQMKEMTDQLIAGWVKFGLKSGERVLLLCDPSNYWFMVDTSILSVGAVSVPRATDVTDDDILYISNHAECSLAIVQNQKTADKLKRLQSLSKIDTIKKVLIIEEVDLSLKRGSDTLFDIIESGKKTLTEDTEIVSRTLSSVDEKALATLIYTSGTTGAPKGVMLSQYAWIQAVSRTLPRTGIKSSDRALSLLPPWHALERAIEYAIVSLGVPFMISDISSLRDDLKLYRPSVFPSVPRIWESVYNGIISKLKNESPLKRKVFEFAISIGTVYNRFKSITFGYSLQIDRPNFIVSIIKRSLAAIALILLLPFRGLSYLIFRPIRQALGGRLTFSVSGGSALPSVVDRFLSAIGITVLEGYGMTETAAVISIRNQSAPTLGTVGTPLDGYQVRLINDHGVDVSSIAGAKGTLWVKSDQLLMGYYRRPELNEVVFDKNGFFDTGDLMMLTHKNQLMFAGRTKDTIVLAGGENIEPVPIEGRLLESEYIDQVMVVGDERKTLSALIVPDFDRVRNSIQDIGDPKSWNEDPQIRNLFSAEINRLIIKDQSFKTF
ncbi:MAG: AMP-binding protein, partial [Leptonema sp. (in: Bacteria)]|nr:AMP-binding protein [Leptonema sp. (in: bacteria)]